MRLGILGLGKAGQRHVDAARASAEFELVGVADGSSAVRERFGSTLRSLDELLECDVDAVVIALPHCALPEAGLRAIAAGKHVLLEKPMANGLLDAKRLVDAAAEAEVRLMVNYNHRFRDEALHARQTLEAGTLGDIHFVSAHMFAPEGPLPDWVWDEDFAGGGMMTYSGSHMIDRVLQTVGEDVEAVSATTVSLSYRMGLEDTSAAWLRFSNGVLASLVQHKSSTAHRQGSWETRVFGARGAMRVVSGGGVYLSCGDEESFVESGPDRRFESALEELAASIRETRAPSPSGEEGLAVREVLDALYRAAKHGKWEGIQ